MGYFYTIVSPDGKIVYVVNPYENNVSAIDTTTDTVKFSIYILKTG